MNVIPLIILTLLQLTYSQSFIDALPHEVFTTAYVEYQNNNQSIEVFQTQSSSSNADEILVIPNNSIYDESINIPPIVDKSITSITISAAGDCTIGSDDSFGYNNSFHQEVDNNNYEFFFEKVRPVFEKDDITIVNLETTLTNATEKAEKKFRFRGNPDYAQILKEGSVELVNIANNHIYDYLELGFKDTVETLNKSNIAYCGYDNRYLTEIKGIKVGFIGYNAWSDTSSLRNDIKNDINFLKNQGVKLIIASFHWGIEREYYPNSIQKSIARYSIDCGADLILGHHPHVIQGIETYKGKNIVYSLGNFSFGGNRNPEDKDTLIYQQSFDFAKGELQSTNNVDIIPCSLSSVKNRNNFQPIPLKDKEALRLLKKLEMYSKPLNKNSSPVLYKYP